MRAAIAIAALVVVALAGAGPAAAGLLRAPKLGAAVAPIRLVATDGRPIVIEGLHAYFDTVELETAGDGLVVVNRLPLERYLLGLNEVPTDWPPEALRAQAVAARTYALYTLSRPRAGSAALYGFDICASIECQVFSGAEVVASEGGARWARAVQETSGEVVLHDGKPILARYHSTSGGRTFENSDGFPDEPNYPYLMSVSSTSETDSPLYRWTVEFRLRDLQAMLERAGAWQPKGNLVEVRTIESRQDSPYPDVALKTRRGRLVLAADGLRDVVRELAPEMFPARYPSFAPTSSGRLPETLPSERYRIVTRRSVAVVEGRGWGHGVGMSQWGAHGLAEAGESYAAILGHYYTDTSVEEVPSAGPISVGVAWAQPETMATGSFKIVDGNGKVLVANAIGPWRFKWTGTDTVSIDPPRGFGLPLRVGLVDAPERVEAGSIRHFTIALSRPAEIATEIVDAPFDDARVVLRGAGRARIPWHAPSEPGRYEVTIRASAGAGVRRSDAFEVVVEAGESAPPNPSERSEDPGPPLLLIAAISGFTALGIIALVGTMRR